MNMTFTPAQGAALAYAWSILHPTQLNDTPEPCRASFYGAGFERLDGTRWWDLAVEEFDKLNSMAGKGVRRGVGNWLNHLV